MRLEEAINMKIKEKLVNRVPLTKVDIFIVIFISFWKRKGKEIFIWIYWARLVIQRPSLVFIITSL